jgi:hypothetical protein
MPRDRIAQFAVDRQVEEGQVACAHLKVQFGPNGGFGRSVVSGWDELCRCLTQNCRRPCSRDFASVPLP